MQYIIFCIFIFVVKAIPRRGNEPWSVILCKFANLEEFEPRSKQWFEQWFNGADSGVLLFKKKLFLESISNFFFQTSNGVYTITGSNVHGWFTIPYTEKDILRLMSLNLNTPQIGTENSFDVIFF